MSDEEHIEEMTSSVFHQKGGCVVRHISYYAEENPCSHRGTGYKISVKKRKDWYNEPDAYKAQDIVKADVRSWKPRIFSWKRKGSDKEFIFKYKPKAHPTHKLIHGLWDIDPGKKYNFQRSSFVPYMHNYHHLIPNGVLNEGLYDKQHGSRLLKLLMAGQYNINHGRNIILLPKEERIGRIIGLPAHCPGGKQSHKRYSTSIKGMLNDIKKRLKRALKDQTLHEAAKGKVGNIAEDLYRMASGGETTSRGALVRLLRKLGGGGDIDDIGKRKK